MERGGLFNLSTISWRHGFQLAHGNASATPFALTWHGLLHWPWWLEEQLVEAFFLFDLGGNLGSRQLINDGVGGFALLGRDSVLRIDLELVRCLLYERPANFCQLDLLVVSTSVRCIVMGGLLQLEKTHMFWFHSWILFETISI